MNHRKHLQWPFFESRHFTIAADADAWASTHLSDLSEGNLDQTCRQLAVHLGKDGWLRHAIGGGAYGAAAEIIDTRVSEMCA